MAKTSAGLLMYRFRDKILEVFLVHPGGPFWAKKDHGSWSIPKGEYEPPDNPLEAAKREFLEETGFVARGNFIELKSVKQQNKKVTAWAFEGDCNPAAIRSNTFSMEWPPGSDRMMEFPEVDRAAWFTLETARMKIIHAQASILDELCIILLDGISYM